MTARSEKGRGHAGTIDGTGREERAEAARLFGNVRPVGERYYPRVRPFPPIDAAPAVARRWCTGRTWHTRLRSPDGSHRRRRGACHKGRTAGPCLAGHFCGRIQSQGSGLRVAQGSRRGPRLYPDGIRPRLSFYRRHKADSRGSRKSGPDATEPPVTSSDVPQTHRSAVTAQLVDRGVKLAETRHLLIPHLIENRLNAG
jgi:hypothetical protein